MLYTILNMSITASVLIVIVLFVRVLLKRAPSVFAYMLWGAVLFRLLCPYSVALPISLFQPTDVQTKEGMLYYVSTPSVSVSPAQSAVPPMDGGGAGSALASADPVTVCTVIWAIGVVAFIAAGVIRTVLLKRDLIGAVPIERSVYVADHLAAPFTMGVLRPRIYLPSDLQAHDRDFVVMHERLHIRRGDHLVRLISFLALCLHWFNPLVHVMFLLSERDMERSCDEAVLRRMERDVRAEYASLLLGMTSGRRIRFPAPISFDGDPTRERIKNIMRYRRPRRLTVILLSVVLTLLFVALLVNPFRVYNENVMGADYAADEILFGDVSGVDVVRISADYRLYLKYENEWRSVGALSPYPTEKVAELIGDRLHGIEITDARACADGAGTYLAIQTSRGETLFARMRDEGLLWLCTLRNQFRKTHTDFDFFQDSLRHSVAAEISVCAVYRDAEYPDALFVAFLADETEKTQQDMRQMGFALFRVFDGRYFALSEVYVCDERDLLYDGVYRPQLPVRLGTEETDRYYVLLVHPKNDGLRFVQTAENGEVIKGSGWGIHLFSWDTAESYSITYRIYDSDGVLLTERKIYNGEDIALERGGVNVETFLREGILSYEVQH